MAIYTKISREDVQSIERKFNLGKIVSFKGIKKGIENTNYLLKTKNKKFILTIFEKRVKKKDLPFFMSLMDKLKNHKIQVDIQTKVRKIQELLEESDFVKTTQAKEHVFLDRISMRV